MNISTTRQSVADLGDKWWRFISGRWRAAKKALASICASAPPSDRPSQLALLDAITESAECATTFAHAAEQMASLLGPSWQGTDSDWDLLDAQATWVIGAWKGIHQGTLAVWCIERERVTVDRSARAQLQQLNAALESYRAAVRNWSDRLQIDESRFAEGPVASQPFSALTSRWSAQNRRVDELHALVAFNQISVECEREGLGNVASVATDW